MPVASSTNRLAGVVIRSSTNLCVFWVFSKAVTNPGIWNELETQVKNMLDWLVFSSHQWCCCRLQNEGSVFCRRRRRGWQCWGNLWKQLDVLPHSGVFCSLCSRIGIPVDHLTFVRRTCLCGAPLFVPVAPRYLCAFLFCHTAFYPSPFLWHLHFSDRYDPLCYSLPGSSLTSRKTIALSLRSPLKICFRCVLTGNAKCC